jgi:hypothetical protein
LFANRYTALVDSCSLAGVLQRNLILTLAEAEFFRLRWSSRILDDAEKAISRIHDRRGREDHLALAARQRANMEAAFEDAMVLNFDDFTPSEEGWPDKDDLHVVAAALKTQASVIVTENLKHFPEGKMRALNVEVRSADDFIADTIELDAPRAVAAIRRMRERFKKPEKTGEALLIDMDAASLTATVDALRDYVQSL